MAENEFKSINELTDEEIGKLPNAYLKVESIAPNRRSLNKDTRYRATLQTLNSTLNVVVAGTSRAGSTSLSQPLYQIIKVIRQIPASQPIFAIKVPFRFVKGESLDKNGGANRKWVYVECLVDPKTKKVRLSAMLDADQMLQLDVTNHLNDVDGLGMVDRGLVEKLDGVWVAPDEAEE